MVGWRESGGLVPIDAVELEEVLDSFGDEVRRVPACPSGFVRRHLLCCLPIRISERPCQDAAKWFPNLSQTTPVPDKQGHRDQAEKT